MQKTALISVSDKTGLAEFAAGLKKLKFEILSTGGTFDFLRKNKITATRVEDITEFPEILGGRVKTLHPKIFGGILARDSKSDSAELAKFKIPKIDLVCVNLYPFEKTIAQKNVKFADAIENIDIGGVSLIRAAAKNFESVAVVSNPNQYSEILAKLKNGLTKSDRQKLAADAFAATQKYDALIANFLEAEGEMPVFEFQKQLRYGENPHQSAQLFHEIGNRKATIANAEVLGGKELSFNNLMDADFAIRIPFDFARPTAAIIKHANPCGVASDADISGALEKALNADKKSPFGGIIALNRPVDKKCAEIIQPLFMEVIIAPSFAKDALALLQKKKNLRLLAIGDFANDPDELDFKKIGGGVLVQKRDVKIVVEKDLKIATKKPPTKQQIADLIFAAKVCKHAKSNAIVIAKNEVAVGIGAGQTARVDAVEIAIAKAGTRVSGAVLASDAFFPFDDSVQAAAKAGIAAIIQPGGSIRDADSIIAADRANVAMVFSGVRGFKH
ncbi:MAG: bifunctional phosphoribosylaminoimidazolecarboxamide formyltransferase/IMP cyclohydrolase [Patescibacteria group bacterium]